MRLIVLDLESNQPSGKIIQIGALVYNVNEDRVESKFNEYANPGEPVTEYITELTGITQKVLDVSDSLTIVLQNFWNWAEEVKCKQIGAWGSDVWDLIQQSKELGVSYPSRLRNIDIKAMSMIFRAPLGTKQRGGLKSTLELFKLDPSFLGRQHDAYDDAFNTARLLRKFYEITDGYHKIRTIIVK